ncbi:hypothetical protein F5887DRAFT_38428 [Amanita rubescens]|nr:hypothetical protein F5887DRAFT_38428 [Amanita rubescens]
MNQPQRPGSRRARLSRNSILQRPGEFFWQAHNFQIEDSRFYDASQNVHYHDRKVEIERLQQYVSEGALHDSRERSPQPTCHPNTRQEVLKIITDWVKDSHPRQRILWLNGPAGAGKSAIAQTIAERCSNKQLAASFFFLRNSIDRGSATLLFTTLAWQLGKNIPEILPYLESAVEEEPLLPTKSIDIQFDRLIIQPFQKLLHDKPDFRPTKVLVIIDGVDECAPDQDQLQLLGLIGNALSNAQIPLRFLMCSRAEAHIKETFGLEVVAKITNQITLDHRFSPDVDIRRYLEEEFARIYTERKPSSFTWPPYGAIDQLVSKSSGLFIYPSTVVKFVGDIDSNPRTQLNIVLKTCRPPGFSSPFAELDQLYIQILSQQPDTRLLRDLFALIIALGEPDIGFVCRRLLISEDELKRKLRRLHSLVRISESVIDTFHLSLHDFFCDKKRAGKYFIHPVRVACVRLPDTTRPGMQTAGMVALGGVGVILALTGVGVVLAALGMPAYWYLRSRSRPPNYQQPIIPSHSFYNPPT